jgi:hypothetical protein
MADGVFAILAQFAASSAVQQVIAHKYLRTPRFYTHSLPLCVKIVLRKYLMDVHLFLRRKRKNK